ncbi:MAG: hypothetical protein PVH61_05430 [Candidatus Aminicenantes bacterium]|jgi:hypothetical protein
MGCLKPFKETLKNYLDELSRLYLSGLISFSPYIPVIKKLIHEIFEHLGEISGKGERKIEIESLEAGSITDSRLPVVRVWDGTARIHFYIELIHPNTQNIDIQSDLMAQQYTGMYLSFVYTNFFCFFSCYDKHINSNPLMSFHATNIDELNRHKEDVIKDEAILLKLFKCFLNYDSPYLKFYGEFLQALIMKVSFLREHLMIQEIKKNLFSESNAKKAYSHYLNYLEGNFKITDLSSLLSHNIADGFLTAWIYRKYQQIRQKEKEVKPFCRKNITEYLVYADDIHSNRYALFEYLSSEEISETIRWMLDDIASLFMLNQPEEMIFWPSGSGMETELKRVREDFVQGYYSNDKIPGHFIKILKREGLYL